MAHATDPKTKKGQETAPAPKVHSSAQLTGGPFDFFRKYQKLLIYTAGIFALVSFSITGALIGFFTPGGDFKGPKMVLPNGRVIQVTEQDWMVGAVMINAQGDPAIILPNITSPNDTEHLRDRYAALRRLAIEFGIEASEDEVDRAIAQATKIFPQIESPTRLAQANGYSSLGQYRKVLKEALRISTFLRLQAAGVDTTDAALAKHILKDQENLTLRLAAFDKKAEEKKLEEGGVSSEELTKFLEELPDAERAPYQDRNHVSLSAVGILYENFDPSEFAAELEGIEFDAQRLKQEYELRKAMYFRKPEPENKDEENEDEENKPEENKSEEGQGSGAGQGGESKGETGTGKAAGEAGQSETGKEPENAGAVPAAAPMTEVRVPQNEASTPQPPQGQPPQPPPPQGQAPSPAEQGAPGGETATQEPQTPPEDPFRPFDEVEAELLVMLQAEAALDALRTGSVQKRQAEHMRAAIEARNAATVETAGAKKKLAQAEKSLEEEPEDADRKAAVEVANAGVETAEEAEKVAEELVDASRKSFDFAGVMRELIGNRKGFETHPVTEPVKREELKELGPFGTWENAFQAEAMSADGDISTRVERTKVGCFHFQVPEVVETPLKPFEDIEEQARTDYFAKKADEMAEAGSEKLEAALLEMAKARMTDKIAELEKEDAEALAKEFDDWQSDAQAKLDEAEEMLVKYQDRKGFQFYKAWEAEAEKRKEALAEKDDKRVELEEQHKEELEAKIAEEAAKLYKDVLDEAVADTGFAIEKLEPYPQSVGQRPRFQYDYPEQIRFLFGNPTVTELEAGEATEMLDDATNRALYLVVCDTREPATLGDLTRRQIEMERDRFVQQRLTETMQQAFSMEALSARWGYETLRSDEEEEIVPSGEQPPEPAKQEGQKPEGQEGQDPGK